MEIELRSDTFTKPTKAMLQAMMDAVVGDDVFEEDTTTIHLQSKAAAMFGYEDALFCTSGTMANQIALNVHTQPGDEIICDSLSHIYLYEGGGVAANSLCSVRLLQGDNGRLSANMISENINPNNIHHPITKVVSLENTVNKGGGSCYDFGELEKIKMITQKHNLKLHLDGARLFNALIKTQVSPKSYGLLFDSISICLSKGLGAPVGSILMGNKNFINQAKRVRKRWGGGWRQSGYLAAAGIFALDHHVLRLKEDHIRAQKLAHIFSSLPMVINSMPVETNIVIFEIDHSIKSEDFVNDMAAKNIKLSAFGPHHIRLVTHLDFGDDELDAVEKIIKSYKK